MTKKAIDTEVLLHIPVFAVLMPWVNTEVSYQERSQLLEPSLYGLSYGSDIIPLTNIFTTKYTRHIVKTGS
jgi:hypothetical protein